MVCHMLTKLTNEPRDYAWGSHTLLAELEGRAPAARPEAEVWFGDHPSDPAELPDGSSLDSWTAAHGAESGLGGRLPYLLKLLAAGSPLSIQVHPSLAQAREGFAREEAAADGAVRNYADDNHKPEMIVALRDGFEALCGLRPLDGSIRLLRALGPAADPVVSRLEAGGPADAIGWLLSGEAQAVVDAVIASLDGAESEESADAIGVARRIAAEHPGDPGVVVALLMNLVTLRAGEAVFLRAGLLHAYVSGIGVEIMAASDNVLRGGLTRKHIDVDELMAVLDPTPGEVPLVAQVPEPGAGGRVSRFAVPVDDFSLLRAEVAGGEDARVAPRGVAIVLATRGRIEVRHGGETVSLTPGEAALATPDEPIAIAGEGTVFVAAPGR